MKILNNKTFFIAFCVLILPIIIYWKWFFNFDILTSGDWGFFLKEYQKTLFSLPFAWQSNAFGAIFLTASSYFTNLLWGIFGFLTNFQISERIIYFWPAIIISSVGSYCLANKILHNKIAAIISSFIFCYNTYFILSRTGHLTLMVAFAFAPLILYFFIKNLEEKKYKIAIVTGLLCSISSFYEFRSFYIIAFILFFYTLYYIFFIDRTSLKSILNNFKFAVLPVIMVFLLNIFWILGLLNMGSISNNEVFSRGLFGDSFMNILRSITLFHPFWNGSEPESFVVQRIPIYFFLTPVFAFFGLVLNKKNKNVLFFGFVSLLGIFLAKQSGEPFVGAYKWLYDNFPGFNAFRESSKFYFLVALGYSVLIGSFVGWLFANLNKNKIKKYKKYILVILIASIFLWNAKPVVTGEIKTLFVSRNIPNDYLVFKDYILKQPEYFRTYWTPRDSRWGIYMDSKPKVSNVDIIQADWRTYVDYEKNKSSFADQIIDVYKKDFSDKLFDVSSVKYIIVPLQDKKNDDDFFAYYGGQTDSNIRQWYINELDKISWLKKINIGAKNLVIYENENYRDHLYLTSEQESIYKNINPENVAYQFKNPTEYKISLKNVKENTYLNFSEKYHPDWSLRVGDFNWFNVLTNKNYFIDNRYHSENDAMLNSFLIDPSYIKQNFDKSYYKENPDGSIDVELTLYFKPQSYFYLGLIISGTTLLGCLGYLGWDFVKRRKEKKKNSLIEGSRDN